MGIITSIKNWFFGITKENPNKETVPPSSQSIRPMTTTVFNGSETGAYKRASGEAYLPISTEVEDRFPLMPTWYFSAKLGQPRKVDVVEVRQFAESPWVRMAVNSILKQLFCTERVIVLKDESRGPTEQEKAQMEEALNFLEHPGFLNESFENTWYPFMHDVLTIDQPAMYKGRGTDGKIIMLKSYDGSKFLVDMDWHGFVAGYYEYSFRYPITNPRFFSRDDIIAEPFNWDMDKYPYGFSPVQQVQQVIEVLIQSTRWNKEFYKNNAVPNAIIKAVFKNPDDFAKFMADWNQHIKGQPNKTAIVNTPDVDVKSLIVSNRDMEWLEGQRWYFHLVFGVFGLSPQEAGFYEDSNRSTSESMERLSVRNAIRPYLKYLERIINKQVLEDPGMYGPDVPFKFEFKQTDDTKEQLEHDQMMQKLQMNVYTINEVRSMENKEPVEWGNQPFQLYQQEKSQEFYSQYSGVFNSENKEEPEKDEEDEKETNETPKNNEPLEDKKEPVKEEKAIQIDKEGQFISEESKSFVRQDVEELIEDSKDYSDFLERAFRLWEKKVLAAADEELRGNLKLKSFNNFLVRVINGINSLIFVRGLKPIIKRTLSLGIEEAEKELNINLMPPENFDSLVEVEYNKQLNGYLINGRPWVGLKGVSIQVQKEIIDTVNELVKSRASLSKIKEAIKDIMDTYKGYEVEGEQIDGRAMRIARTETSRIKELGKLKAFSDSGLEGYKVWQLGTGCVHCEECKSLHGQKVGINELFYSSLTNKTHESAPAHPNCTCYLKFKLKETA